MKCLSRKSQFFMEWLKILINRSDNKNKNVNGIIK